MKTSQHSLLVILALLVLYLIWGSTYLAMHFALQSLPPFLMAALRFLAAGGLLFGLLRWRGQPMPSAKQWIGVAVVASLLLVVGNGSVAYAQQTVASGVAALTLATTPLWAAVFASLWRQTPSRREWLGILIGTVGGMVLNLGASLQASPIGAMALVLAAMSWALGSVWSRYLPMPTGAMASACQMLFAGCMLLLLSLGTGERWPEQISTQSLYAMAYLIIFGSLLGYSAYLFLVSNVRPALATSYAFVNPVVAMLLGAWLAGEVVGRTEIMAMLLIVLAVVLVLPLGKNQKPGR